MFRLAEQGMQKTALVFRLGTKMVSVEQPKCQSLSALNSVLKAPAENEQNDVCLDDNNAYLSTSLVHSVHTVFMIVQSGNYNVRFTSVDGVLIEHHSVS